MARAIVAFRHEAAWDLHLAWSEAEFHISEDAGRAAIEPATLYRLIDATERFRGRA
ncbi:hypothetical protein ACTWPT_00435 [Nonomuraea sp. 3N208]|uniref:hypothetical protein n=1 Tax=Nonomuraea sp. 3N208 TaxID=3457421 RepID=UPI003FCE19B3